MAGLNLKGDTSGSIEIVSPDVAGNTVLTCPTGVGTIMIESTDGLKVSDAIFHAGDTNTKIRFPANDTFTVETNGTEAIRVTSNQRVGIGTDDPTRQLEVYDDNNAIIALKSITQSSVIFSDPDDTNIGMLAYAHADNSMFFRVNDAERLRIASDGDVGIGTANPDSKLHVFGDSVGFIKIETGDGGTNPIVMHENPDRVWHTGLRGDTNDGYVIRDATSTVNRIAITTTGITSVTGTLQINGNNFPTAGPLSNRNLIINGDMRVAQRGISTTTSGHFAVDRFACGFSNLTITTTREELSDGDSPWDEGFRFFTRMTNSAASSASDTFVQLDYHVEAQDMAMSGWDYTNTNSFISVQFWARSSLAGQYYIQLRAIDGGEDYWNHPFNLAANTWTKVEYQVPGNAMVTFDNDNNTGLFVSIPPHYGTDFTGATAQENAWFTRSGNDWYPDFDQDWGNTTGTFDVTGLQIEVGEACTPFEHRLIADEFARCQRYFYRKSNITSSGARLANGAGTWHGLDISFPVTMRAAGSASIRDVSLTTATGASVTNVTANGCTITVTMPSGTNQYGISGGNLEVSAEM